MERRAQKQLERSLEFAVNRHKDRIDRVSISLTDLNGPRGGKDKLCHITAEVRGARPVMILEQGDNPFIVISRAARRLGYRIGRSLHRQRVAGAPGAPRHNPRGVNSSGPRRGGGAVPTPREAGRPQHRRIEGMTQERAVTRLQAPVPPQSPHTAAEAGPIGRLRLGIKSAAHAAISG